jgi:hypothetical protein
MAFNPLGAVQEGYDFAQGLRDRRTMNNAGNALAGGDYRGGANALLQGGMLDQGMGLLNYDQRNRQAEALAMQQQAEAEKAGKVEQAQILLRGAQALRQRPEAERMTVMQTEIMPQLVQMGLDQSPEGQQIIQRIMQGGLSDQQLDSFIQLYGGELQKPEWQIVQTPQGVIAVDKQNPSNPVTISQTPVKPEIQRGPDGLYERQPDGSWKRVQAFGAAPRVFAPRAPRGGGGRGSAPTSGSSELPPGFVLE